MLVVVLVVVTKESTESLRTDNISVSVSERYLTSEELTSPLGIISLQLYFENFPLDNIVSSEESSPISSKVLPL